MESYIDLTERQYEAIWEHLLPDGATCESAAFIFASVQDVNQSLVLRAQDYFLVGQGGFNAQSNNYIELSDESRINVIKKAHQTHTALVELHSHPFNSHRSAAFSLADMNGFDETVPHMWWRLPGRPYAAIVVSPCGFDSLVWQKSPELPECLTALRVGCDLLKPTCMTLGGKYVV
jgi:hypothetical protein